MLRGSEAKKMRRKVHGFEVRVHHVAALPALVGLSNTRRVHRSADILPGQRSIAVRYSNFFQPADPSGTMNPIVGEKLRSIDLSVPMSCVSGVMVPRERVVVAEGGRWHSAFFP